MQILGELKFGVGRHVPVFLQTEATECGLASLAMVACHYGYRTDLATLRARFPISLKGMTLTELISIASELNLATRPLSVELAHLRDVRLPCILHWQFNHFVVLIKVSQKGVVIHDPARGERYVPMSEVSAHFTGIALELWPNVDFREYEEKQSISLRKLLGQVVGISRGISQLLLLAFALEAMALLAPLFLQWVIDEVLVSGNSDLLTMLALGFGSLALLQQAVTALRSWGLMYLSSSISVQWRANLFSHLVRLPIEYFQKRSLGDVVSRFGAIDQIQNTLTGAFLEGILDGVMGIVTLTMMIIYAPALAFVAIGAMSVYALVRVLWYRPLKTAAEAEISHMAKQQSHFLETIRGVKTVKLFGREEERRTTWLTLLVDQINANLTSQKLGIGYKLINGSLFGIENVLVLWLGARLTLDGHFTVGALTAFLAYKLQFSSRVTSLIDRLFDLRMLRVQGERLADIVLSNAETKAANKSGSRILNSAISVTGLSYRYSAREAWVLDNLNFKISHGESVAIVGASGCGKSTLMNLMLGILTPNEGSIEIGGCDIAHMSTSDLRSSIGTVLQDDVLFAGSIADNISFFDPAPDRERIQECAVLAAVASDILAMPMQLNTLVGDMGTVLSGGQKQRVLLARALYKRPRILFLDEATSHLDIEREHEVNSAIARLDVTRVIIAHRPETIASADRVIRIDRGRVISDHVNLAENSAARDASKSAV